MAGPMVVVVVGIVVVVVSVVVVVVVVDGVVADVLRVVHLFVVAAVSVC